ncbi:hypothetical protein O8Q80_001946 [Providencia rettgeri]|nr:hypothetical protein [Providencia rettgeri]
MAAAAFARKARPFALINVLPLMFRQQAFTLGGNGSIKVIEGFILIPPHSKFSPLLSYRLLLGFSFRNYDNKHKTMSYIQEFEYADLHFHTCIALILAFCFSCSPPLNR